MAQSGPLVGGASGATVDVGTTIAGKYRLQRLLGRGAMGEVWAAEHTSLHENVAVKILKSEYGDDEDEIKLYERFQFEAQVAARLSRKTKHIVRVTDHGHDGALVYLVMDLLDGRSLEDTIARGGPLDLRSAALLIGQIARGLAAAHAEGVFHRDLKPANIFLTKDEEGQTTAKILDFGIARLITGKHRSGKSTSKGMILGTPSYMSPEQARGLANLDHRCDVWALAVVAYEALAGTLPFVGDTVEDIFLSICTSNTKPISTVRPGLPDDLDGVFSRAFSKAIDNRFQSPLDFAARLDAIAQSADVGSEAKPTHEPPASSRREALTAVRTAELVIPTESRRWPLVVAIAAVLLLGAGALAWRASQTTTTPAVSSVAPTTATAPPPTTSAPVIMMDPPSTPVSALPVATTQAPVQTAKIVHRPAPTATQPPTATATAAATPTPAPTPAPTPTPTPAPTPTETAKPVDRSKVF